MSVYNEVAERRNDKPHPCVAAPALTSIIETATQLTVGGRLVHRHTHRCVAFCNAVAVLAGIGPLEAR
ncbi:MAG TPA: hypothetical protein VG757_01965 [Devosia sp.]|nr:hypothetical protein [Devosia sp.]